MSETVAKIMGPEYDGGEKLLKSVPDKMGRIFSHIAERRHGPDSVLTPNQLEIIPWVDQDESIFVVTSWHQTPAGSKWQVIEGSFDITTDTRNAYLHHREEGEVNYWLTTVETMALSGLIRLAAEYDRLNSPLASEIS